MWFKLLFQGLGWWRLAGGLAGAWLGWSLLFSGLQCWLLVDHNLLRKDELLGVQYFTIHKPVPMVNFFGAAGVSFNEAEIAELKNQPFVRAVSPFLYNQFRADAFVGGDSLLPAMGTDLFFEALPDTFLDVQPAGWNWREGEVVPFLVSPDYLALYNFGFAQGRNLPQVSEQLVSQLRFQVRLKGRGGELELKGRIAGFTRRINSVLVPLGFLQWANAKFGESEARPSRLMIQTNPADAPGLIQFFTGKKYQYDTEQLKTTKLISMLRLGLQMVAILGSVVIGLGFWVLALSLQLLISQNRERLRKLIWLGYYPGAIAKRYLALMAVLFLSLNIASFALVAWGSGRICGLFANFGYAMAPVSLQPISMGMLALSLVLLIGQHLSLRRQIFRLG